MEKQQLKNKNDIKYRSFYFSLAIINYLDLLPKNYIYTVIGKQLLRSATSIGANIVEAQAGTSKKDFLNYYHIALKSANETKYWLTILKIKITTSTIHNETLKLTQEAIEIGNMLAASILTLKGKRTF